MIPAIIGLNWVQGAAANNWDFNPTNWDWNKTTFNVGFSTAQNGSFYAGLTWGNTGNMIGLGINSSGSPLIVGGELGNTVSADMMKYAAQFSRRIPQHTPSNAAILPWEPSWIDKWSRSDNFLLEFSYEIVDGFALMLQAPVSGPTSLHLTGEPAVGDDMIDGFASTVIIALPFIKITKGVQIATKGSTALFKSFTKSNFRYNLGKLTGNIPANSQAHHVFPQKFQSVFSSKGINIHDPKFGVWWQTSGHLKNVSGYNAAWESFLRTNPSQSQIMNYGRQLMKQYGISVGF
jgi:hypothetical protein